MRFHDQVLSEQDFEQLPAALRRKYFSSLERLRLAKDANGSCPNIGLRPHTPRRPSSAYPFSLRNESVSSAGSTHRSFSTVSSPCSRARTRSRLRKASQQVISPSSTLLNPWEFAALPRAIQRKHFSPEEQYYIASRFNPVILDAADEALYKQYHQSPRSTHSRPSDFDLEDVESEGLCEEEGQEEEGFDDMEVKDMESFSCLDNDNDLDLRLDDYHAINADLNRRQSTISRTRRSFRRGLSLSTVSFRRRSSSSTSLQSPPPVGSNINKAIAPAISLPSSRHRRLDSTTSVDASATHYQDPAAKMKLRVYLASPQKFDEALEFGFPSLHQDAIQSSARPKTSPDMVNGHPKTFLADDTPSLSEDERSEYLQQDSPRTPIDMSFPGRPYHKSSTDRSSRVRARLVCEVGDGYAQASPSDREMTLRMTLTRPELRALEETDHTKPIAVNETPLEKAPLTVPVGEVGSIWDELPEEPSRMKRFFKKLKGRA